MAGTNHLTEQQKQKVAAAIDGKLTACPVCKAASGFSVGDIVLVNPYWAGQVRAGTDSIPMLQVVCSNCFHILHFATRPMGVFEP